MFLKGSTHPSVEWWELKNCTSADEGSILPDYGNASVSNQILNFDTTQNNEALITINKTLNRIRTFDLYIHMIQRI